MSESKYQPATKIATKLDTSVSRVGVTSDQISAFRITKNYVISPQGILAYRVAKCFVISRISNDPTPTQTVFPYCTII